MYNPNDFSEAGFKKVITITGRVALVACFLLAVALFTNRFGANGGQNTARVSDAVNGQSVVLDKKNAAKYWMRSAEALSRGVVEAPKQILELQLNYDTEALPAISIVRAERKNGYAPTSEGPLSVVLVDKKGGHLLEVPFALPHEVEGPPIPPHGVIVSGERKLRDLAKSSFVLTIPWSPSAAEAIIFDEQGNEISSLLLDGVTYINNKPDFVTLPGERAQEVLKGKEEKTGDVSFKAKEDSFLSHFVNKAEAADNNTLDIAFIGEDYTDMTKFYTDVERNIAFMLSVEPFKTRASQIVFHAVENTRDLSCSYNGRLLTCNQATASTVINDSGVPYDSIVIIVNNSTYGGSGTFGGTTVAYNGSWGPSVFVHEFAHSFALLIDEYLLYNATGNTSNSVNKNCYMGVPPVTAWASFEPLDYSQECTYTNWYRPSASSIMRDISVPHFNTPSVALINQKMDSVAGRYINDTQRPTVSIVEPKASTTVSGAVVVSATANDNYGLDRVEFLVDERVIATDYSAPYSTTWSTGMADNGEHTLTATAYDLMRNSTTSSPIAVMVTNVADITPPQVTIVNPANGAKLSGGVTVTANASDNSGAVTKTVFLLNGQIVGADITAPYEYAWNTEFSDNGSYTIGVEAYDASGNIGSSTSSVIVENIADTTSPTVTISSPFNGTIIDGKGSFTVSSIAADDRGIAQVEIKVDGVSKKICTDVTTCDVSVSERNMNAGSHTVTVIATDKAGNQSDVVITLLLQSSGGGNTGGKGRLK